MTVDAYDWAHRTGDNPPDASTADPCTSRPARPNLYEGTFAHEWQHLLHYYTDPFETNWINEGLSDFAQTLVGYVDATKTVDQPGADSHIYCFQGFGTVQTPYNPNPRDCGGAQNSLTLWGEDPNPNAILADYGNAYSMMLYLYDRFGTDFMSALHRDGEYQGIASLAHELAGRGHHDPFKVIHQFQSMVLLDKIVGDSKKSIVLGASKRIVTTPSLRSTVNLDNPESYDTPGAAPNGADYVALRGADGKVLRGSKLKSLTFDGATTLPTLPLAWTVVSRTTRTAPATRCCGRATPTTWTTSAVTPVTRPDREPDADLPRQVRRRGRLRLRLRPGLDRRRQDLHLDRRRQDGRRSARPRAQRHHRRASSRTRSTSRRTPGRACCSASATSATAASTRAVCWSTTSRSAAPRSATAPAWRRSSRRRRSAR